MILILNNFKKDSWCGESFFELNKPPYDVLFLRFFIHFFKIFPIDSLKKIYLIYYARSEKKQS